MKRIHGKLKGVATIGAFSLSGSKEDEGRGCDFQARRIVTNTCGYSYSGWL